MHQEKMDCAICGTALPRWRALKSVVCESPPCTFKFHSLPESEKCVICTRPVPPLLRAERHCGGARCRHTLQVERPIAARKLALEALLASGPEYRAEQAQAHGLSEAEGRSFVLSVIPQNRDFVTPLPMHRRRDYEAHLRKQLAGARRRMLEGAAPSAPRVDDAPEEPLTPRRQSELAILGAGCGTCRGNCCRGGGNHAYQGEESMVRYLMRFPGHDDEAVMADLLQYVPSSTMSEGCVYQREDGCALPRDLRADICNLFFCEGLHAIRFAYRDGRPVRAFFAHHNGHALYGGTFVEMPEPDA